MVVYEGAMFPEWRGDILASGLVAAAIVRLDLDGDSVRGEERLMPGIGRVRDVAVDDDGAIVVVLDSPDAPVLRLVRRD
ncbi:PQQ-dependent sugar dehydrogenase [Roseicyclus elongatus]